MSLELDVLGALLALRPSLRYRGLSKILRSAGSPIIPISRIRIVVIRIGITRLCRVMGIDIMNGCPMAVIIMLLMRRIIVV